MRDARSYLFERLLVLALVAAGARFLQGEGTRVYEARRTLALANDLAPGASAGRDFSAIQLIERKLLELTGRGEVPLGRAQSFAVRVLDARRLQLRCRAESARLANQRCDGVVLEAQAEVALR